MKILFVYVYDRLCLKGLAQALGVFNKQENVPKYTFTGIPKQSILKMHVKPEAHNFDIAPLLSLP